MINAKESKLSESKLYRVHDDQILDATGLESDDVFCLMCDGHAWLWIGKESSIKESSLAWRLVLKHTTPADRVSVVHEGHEPESFLLYLK